MPIIDQVSWKEWESNNQDDYGKCCIDVAREVMRLLDECQGEFDPHKLICEADDKIDAGGITGFMAGCVAQIVSKCHSRGEEFRLRWNGTFQKPGVLGGDTGGVVNPAILTIEKSINGEL